MHTYQFYLTGHSSFFKALIVILVANADTVCYAMDVPHGAILSFSADDSFRYDKASLRSTNTYSSSSSGAAGTASASGSVRHSGESRGCQMLCLDGPAEDPPIGATSAADPHS